jgi:sugar phosphate isomerase/epimerase
MPRTPLAERARNIHEEVGDQPGLCVALRVLGSIQNDLASDEAGQRESRDTMERALELARKVGNAEEAAAALINLSQGLAVLRLDGAPRPSAARIAIRRLRG